MWSDYKKLVWEYYQKRLKAEELPLCLINPSPAKVREECLNVCGERFSKRDVQSLREFFGPVTGEEEVQQAIDLIDIDRFRPLVNYLTGETKDTSDRNIVLLAWLIDFPLRPYVMGMKLPLNVDELPMKKLSLEQESGLAGIMTPQQLTGESGSQTNPDITPPAENLIAASVSSTRNNLLRPRWIIPALLALVSVMGFSIYKFRSTEQPAVQFIGNSGSCLLWEEVQYKLIPCDQAPPGSIIIPADSNLLNNFKRVTRTDTITLKSERKLWYLKRNNQLEVFTAPGNHPEEPHRKLRPLTAYMINKYLLSKKEK